MELSIGGGVKSSLSEGLQSLQTKSALMEASLVKCNDKTPTSPTGRRQNLLANGVSYTNSDEGGYLRPLLKKLCTWNFLDPCNIKILSIKSANNAEQSPSPTSARQTSLSASVSVAMHTHATQLRFVGSLCIPDAGAV